MSLHIAKVEKKQDWDNTAIVMALNFWCNCKEEGNFILKVFIFSVSLAMMIMNLSNIIVVNLISFKWAREVSKCLGEGASFIAVQILTEFCQFPC